MSNEKINYIVDLTGNIDKKLDSIIAEQKVVNEQFDKMRSKAKTAGDGIGSGNRLESMKSGLSSVRNVALGVAASIAGIGYSMLAIGRQNAGMEQNNRALMISSGSSEDYLKNLELLSIMQRKFGANIEASRSGLMSFSASTKGTALQGDKTRKIFQAVTQASGALGLSAEKQGLTFMALSQIASKGTVSMEELRGQLGESLPGALNIAAKSMGMTSEAFQKLVGEGKVLATDFLPKFAEELSKTFSGGFDPDSMTNVLTKWDNAWKTMAETAGGYFKDALSGAADFATLASTNMQKKAINDNLGKTLELFNAEKENLYTLGAAGYGYLVDKYKGKYGENIGTAEGRANIQSKIVNQEMIPNLSQSLEASKTRADIWLSRAVEKYNAYKNATIEQGREDTRTLPELAKSYYESKEKSKSGGFEYKQYLETIKGISEEQKQINKLKSEFPELKKAETDSPTAAKTVEDKFGGTTITARAPQTFNITINELVGIKELNNVTDSKEIGRQSGSLILDELMKAVAQVQMVQG
jgi:tape measure domain-containing protein